MTNVALVSVAAAIVAWVMWPIVRSVRTPAQSLGVGPRCPNCGPRPEGDAKFCSTCGARTTGEA